MLGSQDQTVICVLESVCPQAQEKTMEIIHKSDIEKRHEAILSMRKFFTCKNRLSQETRFKTPLLNAIIQSPNTIYSIFIQLLQT